MRTMVMALAAIGLGTAVAWAQHAHDGSHSRGQQAAQVCETEFEKVVGDGRGFGMAFAADQERNVRTLMDAMFAESKPKSARLLEAEARLRRLFAERAADDASVRATVAEVERARSEVRLVHLLTHLKARDILTEAQRRIYQEARWGTR